MIVQHLVGRVKLYVYDSIREQLMAEIVGIIVNVNTHCKNMIARSNVRQEIQDSD